MKTIPLLIAALLVAGCAPFQNLSVADVRTPSHFVKSGTISVPLDKIKECADKTTYSCGPGRGRIIQNPDNPNVVTLFVYGIGFSQSNPYVIIDFSTEDGVTKYDGYVAIYTWSSEIDEQVALIEACGDCSKKP